MYHLLCHYSVHIISYLLAPFPQPSQPILVDGRNPDKVTIEWEEYMSTVLRYSLCVTKFNEIGCEKNFTTSNTTFLIEGLQAATNYSVAIIAVTETCQSLASNRLNFTTGSVINLRCQNIRQATLMILKLYIK